MDTDIVIGIVLISAALAFLGALTFVARRTIERIASEGFRTARETLRDLSNGK
ncbi:MAG: hypothetical protein JW912_05155 [Sedimentisphaerales bacterium]|nr:hypothetical protein [Sedimentisphaerales bacterium]